MTQVESIQKDIHYSKTKLNNARKVVCKDEIQKLHNQAVIDFYINDLKELRFCLNCAIKQLS
jgi:ribosomal protein S26